MENKFAKILIISCIFKLWCYLCNQEKEIFNFFFRFYKEYLQLT